MRVFRSNIPSQHLILVCEGATGAVVFCFRFKTKPSWSRSPRALFYDSLSRSFQDFGTQVFYWDKYRAELKKSVPKELRNKKKFVPPRVAEYFAGFLMTIGSQFQRNFAVRLTLADLTFILTCIAQASHTSGPA